VPSQDADPRVGTLLCGRYQLFRVVADGGMGRVYEALDKTEKRSVAVKVLHADVAMDEVSIERFKREFEASKSLPHAHIVEVLDFQRTEENSYALVMEFLYGEELRAALKRLRVIEPARLVRILSQLAIGLDEAHARNLVHRDVKPDNIFLCQTSDGDIAKLLDFGSVKDKAKKPLTALGTTIGSPFYMSPEQAQGLDTLDQRADVWAVATIVYECVTGAVPFQGLNAPSILLEILNKEPVPVTVAASGQKYPVPAALDGALSRAMKKTPSLRTRSVGALADAIGHAYGLDGNHRQWATTSQAELGERIDARRDSLDPGVPDPRAGQDRAGRSRLRSPPWGRTARRLEPRWFFSVLLVLAAVAGIALSLRR
jgi:serine/threonine-protein kinase